MSERFVSEDDFVANKLLPDLKQAAKEVGIIDVLDFHKNVRIGTGWADVTISRGGKPVLVIEAKFKKKSGNSERDIEPRDPEVLRQAVEYANFGGFPFYATCNLNRLILFHHQSDRTVFESEVASFDYVTASWANSLLKYATGLQALSLKAPDDTLVSTLHEAFSDIWPEFFKSLKKRLSSHVPSDKNFQRAYSQWLEDQGQEFNDDSHKKVAQETAYLQINKLVFYKVIRNAHPKLRDLRVSEEEDIQQALNEFYHEALRIDYKAVYQNDVMTEIPLTDRVQIRLRTLIDTLSEFDFSKFKSDLVGRVYEKLIPIVERKELGQFYTPASIVDLIINIVINKETETVLDPGCGSGGFLVKSYHRFRDFQGEVGDFSGPLGDVLHQELLNRIFGIDINQFAAHLSVINLAVQNPKIKSNKINVAVRDFFDIKRGVAVLSGFENLSADNEYMEINFPENFDAVVANPPYIRQELVGFKEKEKIRKTIEDDFRDVSIGSSISKARKIILDKQSDIYIYFFIHGLRFLKNGGKLGFISPNKWLEVGYGEAFQRFLLNHSKIVCIIEFDRAVFADADVDTAITVLERQDDKSRREKNRVKLVRLKQRLDVKEVVEFLNFEDETFEDDRIRINTIPQRELVPGKWNIFLRAPTVYSKVIRNPKVRPLGELAEVYYGVKPGSNEYFVLGKEMAKEWSIEKEYLEPVVASPKDVSGLIINRDTTNSFFFACDKKKEELKQTHALRYIEYGEKLRVQVGRKSERSDKNVRLLPQLETIKNRDPWYSLPIQKPADILVPAMIRTGFRVFYNKSKAQAKNTFNCIRVRAGDPLTLAGYLNSSLGEFLVELASRAYTGMLELQTYELKGLPVIDITQILVREQNLISKSFLELSDALSEKEKIEEEIGQLTPKAASSKSLFEQENARKLHSANEKVKGAKERLDESVYAALNLTSREKSQIKAGLAELTEIRKSRAHSQ